MISCSGSIDSNIRDFLMPGSVGEGIGHLWGYPAGNWSEFHSVPLLLQVNTPLRSTPSSLRGSSDSFQTVFWENRLDSLDPEKPS
jgi:hypothetical protein